MVLSSGFGLGDGPFSSGGYSSFDDLSSRVASSVPSVTSTGGSTGGTSSSGGSGGGFFDNLLGAIGSTVERVADFGTQLFIFDELSERGQVQTGTGTTTTTGTGTTGTQTGTSTGTTGGSLIKGIPNEVLFIGVGLLLVLLLIMKVK